MGTQVMTTVNVEWDDEANNIVLWRFERHWKVLDYYKGLERSHELVGTREGRVDVIVDMPSFYIPTSNVVNLVKMGVRQRRPNLGLVIFVTQSMFWHRAFDIVKGLFEQFQVKLVFAKSVDEARAIIRDARSANKAE